MMKPTENPPHLSPTAGEPTPSAQLALNQAEQGTLTLIDLLDAASRLSEAGHLADAARLYRTWLDHTRAPLAYVAQFNLGTLLDALADSIGAEAAYRAALTQQPKFGQAYLNLGLLQERLQRPEEALQCWAVMLGSIDLNADKALYVQALNHLGRLLEILERLPQAEAMFARSLEQVPAQPAVLAHQLRLRQGQASLAASDAGGR